MIKNKIATDTKEYMLLLSISLRKDLRSLTVAVDHIDVTTAISIVKIKNTSIG